MNMTDNNILGMGAKVHAANKTIVPPDKAKEVDDDNLGMEAKAHAAAKAAIPPNKANMVKDDVLGVGVKSHAADKVAPPRKKQHLSACKWECKLTTRVELLNVHLLS